MACWIVAMSPRFAASKSVVMAFFAALISAYWDLAAFVDGAMAAETFSTAAAAVD